MKPRRPVAHVRCAHLVHGLAVFGGLAALVMMVIALLARAASHGTAVL